MLITENIIELDVSRLKRIFEINSSVYGDNFGGRLD
jgi:hypothetical protein